MVEVEVIQKIAKLLKVPNVGKITYNAEKVW